MWKVRSQAASTRVARETRKGSFCFTELPSLSYGNEADTSVVGAGSLTGSRWFGDGGRRG